MKIIWMRGEATVRDVYEELRASRPIAYTTVMTMLGVLEGKDHVAKIADERAFIYKPARPKEEVIGSMVADFVARVFNGSAVPLVQYLVDTEQITREQLAELARSFPETEAVD